MKEIIEKLNDLIGDNVEIDGKVTVIEKVAEKNNRIVVSTPHRTYVLFESEALKFLNSIGIVSEAVEVKNAPVMIRHDDVITDFKANSGKVTDVLLSMLDKVNQDDYVSPDTINKAKAVCQIAGALVGIEKVKQSYIALANK